ncbi:hypothetical protein M8C21_001326, partial [Ambrosia artemisiifolia]
WLKSILDYAFSHNCQQLTVTCVFPGKLYFPLYLFRSQSLKYLRLTGSVCNFPNAYSMVLASTWELPALTTLHLDYVTFFDNRHAKGIDHFSKCTNLKNLTISHFTMWKLHSGCSHFTVCNPRLCNLTLEYGDCTLDVIQVVAPQLENLTIRDMNSKHLITAPNLTSLLFDCSHLLQFSTDLCSLEKADICISSTDMWNGQTIAALLQRLCNVKFLTLNLELIKPLSSYLNRIALQPSPFANLKSLKIYPVYVHLDDEAHKRVNMSTKVKKYLLDGSPGANFTRISYKEIKEKQRKAQAIENAAAAQNLMENFQVMLEKEKANIGTHIHIDQPMEADAQDQGNAPLEKVQLQFDRKMAQMKSYWEDVRVQIDRGRTKTCDIISQLRDIEVLLLKDLPTSKRDELQACFFSLCAEADTVVKKILHHMKTPQIHFSHCFNELATTSLQSN